VVDHRAQRGGECRLEITLGGEHHGAAAGADSRHPGAVHPLPASLERIGERFGFGHPAQFDECLHRVGHDDTAKISAVSGIAANLEMSGWRVFRAAS
jgi:hypothetical protein